MIQTRNTDRKVPTRRISFATSLHNLPKHFADNDLIASHLMAGLSAVFPDGEDFFVRSVRNFRDQITDPELKRQVAGFIGQESMHGREHRGLNNRFGELGFPTKRVERLTTRALAIGERLLPVKWNLAVTAALEHYTATLAELLLSNDDARALLGHDEVKSLFLWHALEESEHKAVAFDVYKAVGGSERIRVFTMNVVSIAFLGGMALEVVASLLHDPSTYRRKVLLKSWRRFRASPFMSSTVWRDLRDYNREDFHPEDRDTGSLIDRWREDLFGSEGTLNNKLSSVTPELR